MPDGNVADQIRRSLKVIAGSVIGMYLLLSGFAIWNYFTVREINDKLCTHAQTLQDTVNRQDAYLDMSIQERVERFGSELGHIPEEVIESQMRQNQRNLDSLGGPC